MLEYPRSGLCQYKFSGWQQSKVANIKIVYVVPEILILKNIYIYIYHNRRFNRFKKNHKSKAMLSLPKHDLDGKLKRK